MEDKLMNVIQEGVKNNIIKLLEKCDMRKIILIETYIIALTGENKENGTENGIQDVERNV